MDVRRYDGATSTSLRILPDTRTTLFWLAVTIGAYRLSLEVRKHWVLPLATPVVLSTATLIAALLALHATMRVYESAKDIITMLLGPATVALAIPLYKNRTQLGKTTVPALAGLAAGSLAMMRGVRSMVSRPHENNRPRGSWGRVRYDLPRNRDRASSVGVRHLRRDRWSRHRTRRRDDGAPRAPDPSPRPPLTRSVGFSAGSDRSSCSAGRRIAPSPR